MKHTIEVNGIKVYAHHGCLKEETAIGGHYIVDIYMNTDFSLASQNDDLSETINYVDIHALVKREMAIPSKLIEHVGQRIVESIKSRYKSIKTLRVKVIKICPPINGDVHNVAIIIED
jgi:dihydroneopterin aldolase